MQCPACGSAIWNERATACPNCGQRLSGGAAPSSGESQPGGLSGNNMPEAAQAAPDGPPVAFQMPDVAAPSPAPATPGTWPSYPPVPPGYAPNYAPGAAAPGYGQPASASSYPYLYGPPAGAAYGQPAPPLYAPYAPSPYAPYPPPLSPLPAPRKRSGGRIALLVIGIVAAVVVVCGGGLGLLYYAGTHLSAQTVPGGNPFAVPGATAPHGTVVFQDSMTDPSTGWSNVQGECFYGSGGYHVQNGYTCYAPAGVQTDMDIRAEVMQTSGPTNGAYGVTFRATPRVSRYDFVITSDSHWAVFKCIYATSTCTPILDYAESTAIQGGLRTGNTVEVKAIGSHFDFYINGTHVGQLDDTTLASGLVGVHCNTSMECVFTNFIVTRPS